MLFLGLDDFYIFVSKKKEWREFFFFCYLEKGVEGRKDLPDPNKFSMGCK